MKTAAFPLIPTHLKPHLLKMALSTIAFSNAAWGATYTVSTTADSGAGSLRTAITSVNNITPTVPNTIVFTVPNSSVITLASSLPAINTSAALTIDGSGSPGLVINGNHTGQAFFVIGSGNASNPVIIQNMAIENAKALGATGGLGYAGGGGGAGAGGAVFVNNGAVVMLSNLSMTGCSAVGGTGGMGTAAGPVNGGGGGAGAFGGGAGGAAEGSQGGGGGGGLLGGGVGGAAADGGNGSNGAGGGGGGASATTTVNIGGSPGGGNGAASPGLATPGTGTGGGGGASSIDPLPASGGPLGGGGGGGSDQVASPGGNGGYGAGGGGAGGFTSLAAGTAGNGGVGGGGGGGAGNNGPGGTSAFGGGSGASQGSAFTVPVGGGGGAAFGGALFVHQTGTLILGNSTFSGNSVTGGQGGSGTGTGGNGNGYGIDIFMAGGATITFNNSTPLTLANPIVTGGGGSGGGVNINGTGVVSFSGANNYTGTTTINNGGHLALLSGATIATAFPTINVGGTYDLSAQPSLTLVPSNLSPSTSNGTIIIPNSPVITAVTATSDIIYNGILAGTGAVTYSASSPSNTITLQGANSYSGGTVINEGTLILGAGGSLSSSGAVVVNTPGSFDISQGSSQSIGPLSGSGLTTLGSNTLTIDQTSSTSYSGAISGTGGFVLNGGGTLTLSAVHTYTGGTTINNGTLALTGSGALATTGDIFINSTGIFDLTASTNATAMIGALSGSGNVHLGNVVLTTNSSESLTFSGVISGTSSSGLTKAGSGTLTLSGINTYTGNTIVSSGTVIIPAGASLASALTSVSTGATLKGAGTVGGLTNAGTLIPGSSIGTLHVTGDYVEGGTLQIEINSLGASSMVAATGNLTINPGATLLLNPDPGVYSKTQDYTIITFGGTHTGQFTTVTSTMPNRFQASAVYNPNNVEVIITVTTVPFSQTTTGGNPSAVAAYIDTLNPAPGSDLAYVIMALDALTNDPAELSKAMNELQPSQFSSLAMSQQNNDILVRSTFTQRMGEIYPLNCNQQWLDAHPASIWLDPVAKYVNQDATQQNHGFHAATVGGVLGGDYRVAKNAYVGAAVAYTFADVHMNQDSGTERINSAYGAVYGTWFNKRMFANASFMAAHNHYNGSRYIDFPGVDRTARNEHNGYQLSPSVGVGMLYNHKDFQFQPLFQFDYVYTHQDKFTEHGAQSIDLVVKDTNSHYVRTDLGIKISQCYLVDAVKIIPDLKLSWVWDKQIDHAHYKARFVDTTGGFVTTGLHPVHNLFAPGIGVNVMSFDGMYCFSAYYDAEVGKKFWENRGYLNFRVMF